MKNNHSPAAISQFGFFLRSYWLVFGNPLLAVSFISIIKNKLDPPFLGDLLYWCISMGLIFTRYFDIRFFKGQTSKGRPATMVHFKMYSMRVLSISVIGWLTARFFNFIIAVYQ